MNVGDRVRVERDETRYPPKGTWPQFRGRMGTVVEINVDRKRRHLTERGVVFGAEYSPNGKARPGCLKGSAVTWFKAYEMQTLASQRDSERVNNKPLYVDVAAVLESMTVGGAAA